jgi:CheY-like chemotaxis protein
MTTDEPSAQLPASPSRVATVLVVDDHSASRSYLTTLLGYHRYALLEAADGAEALALARACRPDLVIADLDMPRIDGPEFVRRIRADPAVARTPVIFCTAHGQERQAEDAARACGVAYLLPKPCEPEEVLRVVREVLRERGG